ncbi:hypothetical protein [Niabella hibiscisoli]|uniref:hypothetical protein n=1 Tax=Niabella hibiscisoli TaxID=1825928 RepID=UPI001F0E3BE8|nr:hypothetical protein [Niabella hibiscisoli]MCH5718778.1 hypothetical protein [Niabella hibiscisoli]
MSIYRFSEVLNDTLSYFLLGDLVALNNYKKTHNLPDDLATEFTTRESGDQVVADGVMIPLSDVANYPYTIIFNLSETPELLKPGNQLQLRQSGYILKVESGSIMLFTWWILNNFTDERIAEKIQFARANQLPIIELENGWYKVEILGGQIVQSTEITNQQGQKSVLSGLEPAFEFLISKTGSKESCTADIFRSYKLGSDAY